MYNSASLLGSCHTAARTPYGGNPGRSWLNVAAAVQRRIIMDCILVLPVRQETGKHIELR